MLQGLSPASSLTEEESHNPETNSDQAKTELGLPSDWWTSFLLHIPCHLAIRDTSDLL